MTFEELCLAIDKHNEDNHITRQYEDKDPLHCFVVIAQSSFDTPYTKRERTYQFRSDEKYFLPSMCGSSIFANCLDNKDNGVRLDYYIFGGGWEIEDCYCIGKNDKELSRFFHRAFYAFQELQELVNNRDFEECLQSLKENYILSNISKYDFSIHFSNCLFEIEQREGKAKLNENNILVFTTDNWHPFEPICIGSFTLKRIATLGKED